VACALIDHDHETVFRPQVEAFNAHHIDSFLATYADDTLVAGVTIGGALEGAAAIRAYYVRRLEQPGLRSSTSQR